MNEPSSAALDLNKIKDTAIRVITRPVAFFRQMPQGGGLQEPLLFVLAISVVVGLIRALLMLANSFWGALGMLVVTPIFSVVLSFISAAILLLIWKLMGSSRNYETAYRCAAYAFSIVPITILLAYIPLLGGVAGTAWSFYLLYVASIEVHQLPPKKSQRVWGLLFVILALFGLSAEIGARKMQKKLNAWEQKVQSGEMTPEEAGRILGEFMRGMEKGTQEKTQD